MPRPTRDVSGERFGRLVAIERIPSVGKTRWAVRCDCGTVTSVSALNLLNGHTQSCGCLMREKAAKVNASHGARRSGIDKSRTGYQSWAGMIQRCTNPRSPQWPYYGGRGVAVCDRWRSFENFLKDMGPRPSPSHSIDRIDPAGDYKPENCRWATPDVQGRNRRDVRLLDLNDDRISVRAAAAFLAMPESSFRLCLFGGAK